METTREFLKWKRTKTGLLITGTVELVAAYVFASLAIDTGSYWHYLLAAVLVFSFLHTFILVLKNHVRK